MANGKRVVKVQDGGTYEFPSEVSQEEIRRALGTLSGQSWIGQAVICENPRTGELEFKRPAAAPKGL